MAVGLVVVVGLVGALRAAARRARCGGGAGRGASRQRVRFAAVVGLVGALRAAARRVCCGGGAGARGVVAASVLLWRKLHNVNATAWLRRHGSGNHLGGMKLNSCWCEHHPEKNAFGPTIILGELGKAVKNRIVFVNMYALTF